MPGRRGDFLAAHVGQLIDLLAEFGRIGVRRDQLGDEGLGLRFELRSCSRPIPAPARPPFPARPPAPDRAGSATIAGSAVAVGWRSVGVVAMAALAPSVLMPAHRWGRRGASASCLGDIRQSMPGTWTCRREPLTCRWEDNSLSAIPREPQARNGERLGAGACLLLGFLVLFAADPDALGMFMDRSARSSAGAGRCFRPGPRFPRVATAVLSPFFGMLHRPLRIAAAGLPGIVAHRRRHRRDRPGQRFAVAMVGAVAVLCDDIDLGEDDRLDHRRRRRVRQGARPGAGPDALGRWRWRRSSRRRWPTG